MLIMITNRCNENCPHCMEDSNPNGQMMDERTFHKAVMFAKYIGCSVVTISGGEPTMHPDFFKFCKSLEVDYKMCFTVVSNGTWYNDKKIERQVRRICSGFKYFISMQVYTNKSFYRDYEAIKAKKPFFDSFYGRVIFEESPIRSMQDLGRAKTCELAQKMCDESQYHQSCLNANLAALASMADFDPQFAEEEVFCDHRELAYNNQLGSVIVGSVVFGESQGPIDSVVDGVQKKLYKWPVKDPIILNDPLRGIPGKQRIWKIMF